MAKKIRRLLWTAPNLVYLTETAIVVSQWFQGNFLATPLSMHHTVCPIVCYNCAQGRKGAFTNYVCIFWLLTTYLPPLVCTFYVVN